MPRDRSLSIRDALDVATAALSDAEDRPGQRAMAEHVAHALDTGRHVVVQAGTGTGKTLGYLVPIVLSGRRAVVTTATKALQDQIARKDLPLLRDTVARELKRDLSWAVVKGRQNYLCRQRLAEASGGTPTLSDDMRPIPAKRLIELSKWADESVTGDLSEFPSRLDAATTSAITVSSEECPGARRCPAGGECFAEIARDRAAEADIVVVNTHLYGLDVASAGAVLPEHDVVVIDEVHGLEDIMSDSVALSFSSGRLRWLAGVAGRVLAQPDLIDRITRQGPLLDEILTPRIGSRLASPLPSDLTAVLAAARLAVNDLLDALRGVNTSDLDADQRRLRAQQAATRLAENLDQALRIDDTFVPYVSGTIASPTLEIAPLDVAPVLADGIWSGRTAILTSATVPANLPGRVGLTEGQYDAFDVGSPFDYESNALLYCPSKFPGPNTPEFSRAMHDELYRLIVAAGGRTLALFTSFRALDQAVEKLRPILDFSVLSQRDDANKSRLIDEFSADESSCLFATAGFFQGVDIPGRTLSLVTLDRIPFPRPDEPLLSARRELLGDRAFREIDLPRAATSLAQASGRLIRSASDRGVVTVFDPRLATAQYRKQLLAAMPPMRRTVNSDETCRFLESITRA
ncbi:MAG: ATP-dependent helicase [Acidimicrobiales bacterium mtb01]|nr:ATP-dependent DNA helicase [Actinomycetota bacterium]TEX45330.1 MAG: ATP-dependent helicase [Acidimicrobiales bacterium mtb01]